MSTNIIAILLGILIIVVFFGYRARWKKRQEEFREELIAGAEKMKIWRRLESLVQALWFRCSVSDLRSIFSHLSQSREVRVRL